MAYMTRRGHALRSQRDSMHAFRAGDVSRALHVIERGRCTSIVNHSRNRQFQGDITMSEQTANTTERLTVQQRCAGGCGAPLTYAVTESGRPYEPELHCVDGNSQFRGGHLCNDCETAVAEVLAVRQAMNEPWGPVRFDTMPIKPSSALAAPKSSRRRARKR
jgi:hypothetical protein